MTDTQSPIPSQNCLLRSQPYTYSVGSLICTRHTRQTRWWTPRGEKPSFGYWRYTPIYLALTPSAAGRVKNKFNCVDPFSGGSTRFIYPWYIKLSMLFWWEARRKKCQRLEIYINIYYKIIILPESFAQIYCFFFNKYAAFFYKIFASELVIALAFLY